MKINDRVRTSYLNKEFIGTIEEIRPLTVWTDGTCEFKVRLDEPVTSIGKERTHVLMYALHDGRPSIWNAFGDKLELL